MRLANGIIVGAVVFGLMMAMAWMLRDDETESMDSGDVMFAAGIACFVGVVDCCAPLFSKGTNLAILGPVSMILMIAISYYLVRLWHEKGSDGKEMMPFIVLVVVLFFVTKATVVMTAALVSNSVIAMLITMLPTLVLILSIGFFFADMYYFRYEKLGGSKTPFIVTVVVTMILVLWTIGANIAGYGLMNYFERTLAADTGGVTYDDVNADDGVSYTDVADDTATGTDWVYYYNLDLKSDQDKSNDFNFGANPYAEGLTAADYDRVLRDRMTRDVALAAGDVAWLDAIVGTRYLGEFYESCKGDWAKTINLAKERWANDQGSFYQTLNAFFAFLDTADQVRLDYRTSDLDDQMYMNPFTTNGVPDVIVMTTDDHSGYYLTYVFVIKGTGKFEVRYRVDCGFQPTNVEEVMQIKPDDTPKKEHGTDPTPKAEKKKSKKKSKKKDSKPEGGKDDPTPKNDPTPKDDPTPKNDPTPTPKSDPTPTPKPDPTPTPKKKDPSKGTKGDVTKKNDDPGPGPDTNNGKGATESKKDQPTNSNHGSKDNYDNSTRELQETNEKQKTGSDSNKPSTSTPADTAKVDNNGDQGTGNGSVDKPTEVAPPATVAETEQPISDEPGEAWGGPPD